MATKIVLAGFSCLHVFNKMQKKKKKQPKNKLNWENSCHPMCLPTHNPEFGASWAVNV